VAELENRGITASMGKGKGDKGTNIQGKKSGKVGRVRGASADSKPAFHIDRKKECAK